MYERGDIYYILKGTVDTVGSEQQPGRPAIIVSNNKANEHSPVLEVVYLTTQPKHDLPTHVEIRSTPLVSTALCEQVTSVFVDRIGSYVGTCTCNEMDLIDECLMVSLGLDCYYTKDSSVDDNKARIKSPFTSADEAKAEKTELDDLRIEIARAETERDTYKTLYNDLLVKAMNR